MENRTPPPASLADRAMLLAAGLTAWSAIGFGACELVRMI